MILKLTRADASALSVILAAVGGDPKGPRATAERTLNKLAKEGVKWEQEQDKYQTYGSIEIDAAK